MITAEKTNNKYCNNVYFKGKVDKSVNKYVQALKKETKELYTKKYAEAGSKENPKAYQIIDKRCDDALEKLNQKAMLLHKDTVIKVSKNQRYEDGGLYMCAENKNLLQEWEQKGAISILSMNSNNLRNVKFKGSTDYDAYVTRFEDFVNKINPERLDKRLVRTSIANHWQLRIPPLLKTKKAQRQAMATQKVADEIGYPTTFLDSFKIHIEEVREIYGPKKKNSESLYSKIKNIFL